MNQGHGTRKRIADTTAKRSFFPMIVLTVVLGFFSPLIAQDDQEKEKVLPTPPYMKYFYVSLNESMLTSWLPGTYYSAIKVVDNVYDYPHSSISMDKEPLSITPFAFGGSVGFGFLAYQTSSITWLGIIEAGYVKQTFPNGVETLHEATVFVDSTNPDAEPTEATQVLTFDQTERTVTGYNLLVKIGANFITGLDRLFFLVTAGMSYTERTFVSGLSKYYDGKMDLKTLENEEAADMGLYQGNGKWVRKNYPINVGLELRYYLFNNFSLSAGWLMKVGRKPSTLYYDDGTGTIYTDKTHDLTILSHSLNLGLSLVF